MHSNIKKWAIFCIAVLASLLFGGCQTQKMPEQGLYTAGVYEGEGQGYGGTLKVQVEVSAADILSVTILEHQESSGMSDTAFAQIPAAIVEQNTPYVDSIAGCTITSQAIMDAAAAALQKAGANLTEFSSPEKQQTIVRQQQEYTADVVVVGGGGAGLAAAVAAAEAGADSVILLEKQAAVGGNTLLSAGIYYTEFFQQEGEAPAPLYEPRQTLEWLQELGMEFEQQLLTDNTRFIPELGGKSYISALKRRAEALGCEILTQVQATELMVQNGAVTGVLAQGETVDYTIHAEQGVVLATGGYGANEKMVRQYLTNGVYHRGNIPEGLPYTGSKASTGDGIELARLAGANLTGMEQLQLLPWSRQSIGLTEEVADSIFVNTSGQRFVAEDAQAQALCLAALAQPEAKYFMISDEKTASACINMDKLEQQVALGQVIRADTLDELALQLGVPAELLKESVSRYNTYVEQGQDPEFGRELFGEKIDAAPFYAVCCTPVLYRTLGGVEIDAACRVLDTSGKAIAGLYAAGDVTGIYAGQVQEQAVLSSAVAMGRLAGTNAAFSGSVPELPQDLSLPEMEENTPDMNELGY